MYPDLSYLIHDLFGTQPDNWLSVVKTFGLLLIIAFLVSAFFLRLELKRKFEQGLIKASTEVVIEGRPATWMEIMGNALLGFILGFKLPYIAQNLPAFKEDAAAVLLSSTGYVLWGIVGAGLLGFLKYWDHQRKKLPKPVRKKVLVKPHQRTGDITIVAAISGIIGAKLFAMFESAENFSAFLRDPLGQLLSGSGLAIYGGLIVAFLAVFWYIRRKGMHPLHVMDAVAPALMIGYGVGRIGCQLSGDGDWGIVNTLAQPGWWFFPDWMWAYDYPHNVLGQGVPIEGCTWRYCSRLEEPVFPTPVYETIAAIILFAILWLLRKPIRIPGLLFFIYVIFTGIERFWIEKIRVNPDIEFLGLSWSQAEYISALLLIVGIGGVFWTIQRHRKRATDISH